MKKLFIVTLVVFSVSRVLAGESEYLMSDNCTNSEEVCLNTTSNLQWVNDEESVNFIPYMQYGESQGVVCCKNDAVAANGGCLYGVEKRGTLTCVTPGGCTAHQFTAAFQHYCDMPYTGGLVTVGEGEAAEQYNMDDLVYGLSSTSEPTKRKLSYLSGTENNLISVELIRSTDNVLWSTVHAFTVNNSGYTGSYTYDDLDVLYSDYAYYKLITKCLVGIDTVLDTLAYEPISVCDYQVQISPNPFFTYFDITVTNYPGYMGNITVVNAGTSQIYLDETGVVGETYYVESSSWPTGTYHVVIQFNGCSKSFIVNKTE